MDAGPLDSAAEQAIPDPLQVMVPGQQAALDVLDAWQGCPGLNLPEGIGTAWRADLPGDVLAAGQILQAQRLGLESAQRAMPVAEQRLWADLRGLQAGGGAAFSTGGVDIPGSDLSGSAGSSARSVLDAALRYGQVGASFAAGDGLRLGLPELEHSGQLFEQFTGQVQRSIGLLALVETHSGGSHLATSRVDWFGNIETWWGDPGDTQRSALHARVLNQALMTRQSWLRFGLLITGGAVRVAASLATGPLSLLSIWTTWNYVQAVIKEFRQLNAQQPASR